MIYPSCPIGIACARKNCFKNLPCLWFYDKVSNGVFQSGRWLSERREDERVSWTFYCAIKPENIKIRTQSNMSLLILIKAIHVCYMINPRFTKLVGSRWLGVMPVLFCLVAFFSPVFAFSCTLKVVCYHMINYQNSIKVIKRICPVWFEKQYRCVVTFIVRFIPCHS